MEQCPSDEQLIAFALGKLEDAERDTIHAHLDTCATCQQVLAEAAHAFATAITTPLAEDVDWNTTFQPGALVAGRYVISRFIARGAMGEVYEAYDRDLAVRVALKTVASTACDNSNATRRLKAEVQLARRVSHSNVCRIYDFGTHVLPGSGVQLNFLTMEFVEGETLGQRVRLGGALPLDEARDIARELLLALRAAHGAGVLHRDFKSDNVMLKLGALEQCSAVVLDFGLARDVEQTGAISQSTFVGTFGYMAPELLEGMPHSMASDIYSFGVVWFEILTGQLPFEGATSHAQAVRSQQALPPAPSKLNPSVPPELDTLVLRCLARDPSDRFGTAGQVLDALQELSAPRPISTLGTFRTIEAPASRGSATSPPNAHQKVAVGRAFALVAITAAAAYWLGFRSGDPAPAGQISADTALPVLLPPPTAASPRLAESPRDVAPEASPPSVASVASPAPSASAAATEAATTVRPTYHAARTTPRASALGGRTPNPPAAMPAPVAAPAVHDADAAFPVPSSSSAPAPPAPRAPPPPKPDWENPFGAADRPALVAGRPRSAT